MCKPTTLMTVFAALKFDSSVTDSVCVRILRELVRNEGYVLFNIDEELNRDEVAAILGVNSYTVLKLARADKIKFGHIPYIKGRRNESYNGNSVCNLLSEYMRGYFV